MLKRMRKNKKGFTLAELLIVVAIIGVLVAISIPIFTAQLEKAREATDLANQRAAKAAAVAAYLDADTTGTKDYWYDAASGAAKSAKTGITGYGKGTEHVGSDSNTQDGYKPNKDYVGQIVKVTITEATAASEGTTAKDQGITVTWEE